jgi:hypothetical protein
MKPAMIIIFMAADSLKRSKKELDYEEVESIGNGCIDLDC